MLIAFLVAIGATAQGKDALARIASFSNCTYFSDDYRQALGYYADEVVLTNTEKARQFCLDHFDERQ